MMSRRNKMKSVESLVCLVRAVENQYTTIDLQNETCVHGFVKKVDYNMNITMSDVTLTDPNNKRYYCDNFYLKSRIIRYVHLPPNIDIFSTMKDVIKKTFPPRIKTKSYSFKNKKLVARQEKLKKEVQSKKKLINQLQ